MWLIFNSVMEYCRAQPPAEPQPHPQLGGWGGFIFTFPRRRRRRRRRRPSRIVLFSAKLVVSSCSMLSNVTYGISKWSLEQFQVNGMFFYVSKCLLPPQNCHQSSSFEMKWLVINQPYIEYYPCVYVHSQMNCYQKDWNGNVNNFFMALIMILLTLLLKTFWKSMKLEIELIRLATVVISGWPNYVL